MMNVRFGSKADMCSAKRHVRFTPKSGHVQCTGRCPLCAKSGLMHCSKQDLVAVRRAGVSRSWCRAKLPRSRCRTPVQLKEEDG